MAHEEEPKRAAQSMDLMPEVPKLNDLGRRALARGDLIKRGVFGIETFLLACLGLVPLGCLSTLAFTEFHPLKMVAVPIGAIILLMAISAALYQVEVDRAQQTLARLPVGLRNPLLKVLGEPAFQRTLRLEISLTESQSLGDYRNSAQGRPDLPDALGTVEVTSERKVRVTKTVELTPNSTHAVCEWTVAVLRKLNAVQDAILVDVEAEDPRPPLLRHLPFVVEDKDLKPEVSSRISITIFYRGSPGPLRWRTLAGVYPKAHRGGYRWTFRGSSRERKDTFPDPLYQPPPEHPGKLSFVPLATVRFCWILLAAREHPKAPIDRIVFRSESVVATLPGM